MPPVSYHEDFNSTHMEARPQNVVARETQQSVSSPGHGSLQTDARRENTDRSGQHTPPVSCHKDFKSMHLEARPSKIIASELGHERGKELHILALKNWPRHQNLVRTLGANKTGRNRCDQHEKNRGTPTEAQNFVKEERPESARRSKERWVQHIKTFPSSTREQDKRGELKTHEHDTERPDTKDDRGGIVTSMAFCMATQRNNNIDTTRVREANTSATENKEPNQQPRREPAELRAPRLPVLPRHPFPVQTPSSLEGRSWLASQTW